VSSKNFDFDSIQITVYGFYLFADYKGNLMQQEYLLSPKRVPRQDTHDNITQYEKKAQAIASYVVVIIVCSLLLQVWLSGPLSQLLQSIKQL
jgi:hypothetical protein